MTAFYYVVTIGILCCIAATVVLCAVLLSRGRSETLRKECVDCWEDPWVLDTPARVEWANRMKGGRYQWRLGDHCWYRPV